MKRPKKIMIKTIPVMNSDVVDGQRPSGAMVNHEIRVILETKKRSEGTCPHGPVSTIVRPPLSYPERRGY